jgi:hypothetical protein
MIIGGAYLIFVLNLWFQERDLMGVCILTSSFTIPRKHIVIIGFMFEGEDSSSKINDFEYFTIGRYTEVLIIQFII